MTVTIKDVALRAGVSPSTVSRTCNRSPLISEKTQQKVRKAMEELGYEMPEPILPERKANLIGIILPPLDREENENPVYLELIRGISEYCFQHDYSNTIIAGKDEEEILKMVKMVISSSDAAAFILLYSRKDDPVVRTLNTEEIPYVLVGKPIDHVNETVSVDNDNIQAGQEATEYLIEHGHTRIGFIGHDSKEAYSNARKNGCWLAINEHGLPCDDTFCFENDLNEESDLEKLRTFLQQLSKKQISALVIADDLYTMIVKQICVELGRSIPQDVSIVSFNNSIFSRISVPRITSIDINSRQLGSEAASQAINRIEDPSLKPSKTLVPIRLVEGDSVCKFMH